MAKIHRRKSFLFNGTRLKKLVTQDKAFIVLWRLIKIRRSPTTANVTSVHYMAHIFNEEKKRLFYFSLARKCYFWHHFSFWRLQSYEQTFYFFLFLNRHCKTKDREKCLFNTNRSYWNINMPGMDLRWKSACDCCDSVSSDCDVWPVEVSTAPALIIVLSLLPFPYSAHWFVFVCK